MDVDRNTEGASSSACDEDTLEGWNKTSKFQLYLGIKYRGSKDVKKIREEFLPNKTEEEIETAIAHFLNIANKNPICTERKIKVRKSKVKQLIPLASWAKLLTDSLSLKELQTETPAALRLIADLEDIPSPTLTEQIDFRQIYHHLADAMEGKSIPENRLISEVLHSCVLDTALVGKSFMKVNHFKDIVNSTSVAEENPACFIRPTNDPELSIIRDLITQRNYNPLTIPEHDLTASMDNSPE